MNAQSKIDTLPDEIQELLYSPEMYTAIKQVSTKHQLHIDQMDLLSSETSQVMLGHTRADQFPQFLSKSLRIDQAKASAIAQDINDLLFVKIREAMQKVYEAGKVEPKVIATPEVPKPPATPAPTPPLAVSLPKSPAPSAAATIPTPPPTLPQATQPIPPPTAQKPAMTAASVPPQTTSALDNPAFKQADTILSQPTVSKVPPASPGAPHNTAPQTKSYTTDPYREPPAP